LHAGRVAIGDQIVLKDYIVDEVRRVREEQAAKYAFDVKAILAAARKRQLRSGRKVVSLAQKNKLSP
jgi:hypothetical protein